MTPHAPSNLPPGVTNSMIERQATGPDVQVGVTITNGYHLTHKQSAQLLQCLKEVGIEVIPGDTITLHIPE